MELQIQNLKKAYGDVLALDDVNMTFHNGIYGILGPNGAGKSTFMNILSLLLKKSSGTILLDGEDIEKMGIQYLDHLGYMPQENCLYTEFTLQESLYYVGALKGMKKSEIKQQAEALAKEVDLFEYYHHKIKTYSGGMKKRAMFAQTLMKNPDVLILDEPTAGLDPQKRIELRNIIARLSKDKIVLIATHVVSDIEYIANSILLMNAGKLMKQGSISSLTSSITDNVRLLQVEDKDIDELQKTYEISNLHYQGEQLYARIIRRDEQPDIGIPQPPDLNDVYLYYFGNQV